MKTKTLCARGMIAILLSLGLAQLAIAQTAGTGALTGTVTDPSASAVPNVAVTAINSDTGQARAGRTDSNGVYSLTLLPPGTYKVSFSATGFRVAEVSGVKVNVTETPVLDKVLEIGGQSEQIVVQAEASAIQTATSTLGTVVSERAVAGLP